MNIQDNLTHLLRITKQAETAIMDVYASPETIDVTIKSDDSPLTQADMASHHIITDGLAHLFPDIPVVSEEGSEKANKQLVQGELFWLVDPLDGTKDFISRTDEFTICLALIEGGRPVFGIVSAPALGVTYYGGPDIGSYKKEGDGQAIQIHVSDKKRNVVLGSRSHFEQETAAYIAQHHATAQVLAVGSQLKFPYIAEGRADVYPRFGSTMKLWDLAAGQAILEGAGGAVAHPDGSPIDYHVQTLLVGDFIAQSTK